MKTASANWIGTLFGPPNPFWYEIFFCLVNLVTLWLAWYWGASWSMLLLFFVLGLFYWSFIEYIIHRFLFHFRSQRPFWRKVVYAVHGVHHVHPSHHDKLYIPLFPAFVLYLIQIPIYYMLMGPKGLSLLVGLATMHQFYNLTHHLIHTNAFPNNRMLARLRNHHLKHHEGHGNKCFGVTTTIFDRLFGTY